MLFFYIFAIKSLATNNFLKLLTWETPKLFILFSLMPDPNQVQVITLQKTIDLIQTNYMFADTALLNAEKIEKRLLSIQGNNPERKVEIQSLIKKVNDCKQVLSNTLPQCQKILPSVRLLNTIEKIETFVKKDGNDTLKLTTIEIALRNSLEMFNNSIEESKEYILQIQKEKKEAELKELRKEIEDLKIRLKETKEQNKRDKLFYSKKLLELNEVKKKQEIKNSEELNYREKAIQQLYQDFAQEKDLKRKKELLKLIAEYEKNQHLGKKNTYSLVFSVILLLIGVTLINYGTISANLIMIKSGFYLIGFGLLGLGIDVLKYLKNFNS